MNPLSPEQIMLQRFRSVRTRSLHLCAPLAVEDHVVQPVIDVSPPKWHLGHTTWFFEYFVLRRQQPDYKVFHPGFDFVFNSYYEGAGARAARDGRGHLSRPTVAEVQAYREYVDSAMGSLIAQGLSPEAVGLVELGLQHEQQHQELLVTDIKFILGANPLAPAYDSKGVAPLDLSAEHDGTCPPVDEWVNVPGGSVEVGHCGRGFAFDNEMPRHSVLVPTVQLRQALVTNAEYLAFMADGGYERHELWHAEGWDWVRKLEHRAPLYWRPDGKQPNRWVNYTLSGIRPLVATAPVTHISYYEAFAFCEWSGWRLPTEFEWEAGFAGINWGRRWEWTGSAFQPYPGFRRNPDVVGEYNGKFMVNQQVLRGASFATPPGHARHTYRNFFQVAQRWQYTGIRPARGVKAEGGA